MSEKFESITNALADFMTLREHQNVGFYVRNLYRHLVRIEKRLHRAQGGMTTDQDGESLGLEELGHMVEYISELRFALDGAWSLIVGGHCPESHSPYYGMEECPFCGFDKEDTE